MGRGRKRKSGKRHPSGQLVRTPASDPGDRMRTARQPHRRGLGEDRLDARAESPLGRLALRGRIGEDMYDAGTRYVAIVGAWRATILGPRGTGGSGRGRGCIGDDKDGDIACYFDPENCRCLRIKERYDGAFEALAGAGRRALLAVNRVAVHREEIAAVDFVYLVLGLRALARHFQLTGRR